MVLRPEDRQAAADATKIYNRTGELPGSSGNPATISPQNPKISGPKTVKTTREGPVSPDIQDAQLPAQSAPANYTPTPGDLERLNAANAAANAPAAARGTSPNAPQVPSATPPGQVPAQISPRNLVQDRANYKTQLQANPQLRNKILRIMYNEQGNNPLGTQMIAESMLNRASVRGTPLEEQARWHRLERGGYYQTGDMGARIAESPRTMAMLNQSLDNALNGSNAANYATDNSSGILAANERASGKFNYAAEQNAETFFTPGWGEPDWQDAYQNWRSEFPSTAASR
jgi:PAS domain-containing protein